MKEYFYATNRLGFSKWTPGDLDLAEKLWGNPKVLKFISNGQKTARQEAKERLATEVRNGKKHGVQYWPFFDMIQGTFIGCCGFRPWEENTEVLELGFHLRPEFWRKRYAHDAAKAVLHYAKRSLRPDYIVAGHHPENQASKALLLKLGFIYQEDRFYKNTGLRHPTYTYTLQ